MCVKGEGCRTEISSSTVSPSISKAGDAFNLFAQGEANVRLVKVKAEAGRAGKAPLSISASKGDWDPLRARGEEAAPLPNWGAQRK